ncbi:hypothetical protein [Nocardia donostiensis]|uniref:Uncharacterized protein n=1 Tax=Nocardia donostiensis TaxID=1538463 RepID=A0A1W0B5H6_9NOCA|nr:hypothetical protein [Nocardia donostiensis]ONM48694.1 hypothetical protein B0T46_11750 [Nocardia donostiensis]OQS16884.1 hypothetical protein B0T36_04425 [Nocardia donostiensis]OQS17760.1 hypothetical protein B0T44_23035 [Nocardia donostiensis]
MAAFDVVLDGVATSLLEAPSPAAGLSVVVATADSEVVDGSAAPGEDDAEHCATPIIVATTTPTNPTIALNLVQ